jgi:hypothetical protein
MTSQLNYLLSKEKVADLTRAAERTWSNGGRRPIEWVSLRGGLIARVRACVRVLVRRRAQTGGRATGLSAERGLRRQAASRSSAPPSLAGDLAAGPGG